MEKKKRLLYKAYHPDKFFNEAAKKEAHERLLAVCGAYYVIMLEKEYLDPTSSVPVPQLALVSDHHFFFLLLSLLPGTRIEPYSFLLITLVLQLILIQQENVGYFVLLFSPYCLYMLVCTCNDP